MNRATRLRKLEHVHKPVRAVVVLVAKKGDDPAALIANARQDRGYRPDDESLHVIVISYVDANL